MKARILLPVLLLGAIGGVVAYFLSPAGAKDEPTKVRMARVHKGELVETAAASGTIEPVRQVDVKSRTSGEVVEVLIAEGDKVSEGQVLFRLDPSELERNVAKAKATLERLQASLQQSKASLTVARYQAVEAKASSDIDAQGVDLGVVAETTKRASMSQARIASATVSQRLADIASMEAQIKAAELDLQVAELNLGYANVVAPFAGTVLALNVEKGTIVASGITNISGGTAALTLGNLEELRVVGQIDEAQIGKVTRGQEVRIRVDAYADRTFAGVVEAVSPLGKNTSNVVTFDVEIRVTDKDAALLRSGMSADLEIVTQKLGDVLLVPLTAIVTKNGQRFVKLADGSEKPVKTGATDGNRIAIVEGLAEGDQIQAIGASAKAVEAPSSSGSPFPMGGRRNGSGSGSRPPGPP